MPRARPSPLPPDAAPDGDAAGGGPRARPKLADRIYGQLLERIVADLPPGSRLPSEPALAAQLGASRPVLREALSRLRADGVVVSRHGAGTFVERRPGPDVLRLARQGSVADLMRCFELRVALEGEAAFLAAGRRTADDLAAIGRALEELDGVIARREVGAEADLRFHEAVSRASGNDLFAGAMTALGPHVFGGMRLARHLSLRSSVGRLARVQREHRRIFAAIAAGRPAAARAAMRAHIENARARVLSDGGGDGDERPG